MTPEELFKKRLLDDCAECEKLGCSATVCRRMINEYGPIEATKKLIQAKTAQFGFRFLMSKGENGKQFTMENRVLENPSLFTKDDILIAEWRIENWSKMPKS